MSNRIEKYPSTNLRRNGVHSGGHPEYRDAPELSVESVGPQVMAQVKSFIQKQPAIALGAAVASGLLIGFLTKRK